jgi:hypothetical protein
VGLSLPSRVARDVEIRLKSHLVKSVLAKFPLEKYVLDFAVTVVVEKRKRKLAT